MRGSIPRRLAERLARSSNWVALCAGRRTGHTSSSSGRDRQPETRCLSRDPTAEVRRSSCAARRHASSIGLYGPSDGHYIYFNYSHFDREPGTSGDPSRPRRQEDRSSPLSTSARRAIFPLPTPDGQGLIYAANPTGVDLALWWRPLDRLEPTRLTTGVGEYAEPSMTVGRADDDQHAGSVSPDS